MCGVRHQRSSLCHSIVARSQSTSTTTSSSTKSRTRWLTSTRHLVAIWRQRLDTGHTTSLTSVDMTSDWPNTGNRERHVIHDVSLSIGDEGHALVVTGDGAMSWTMRDFQTICRNIALTAGTRWFAPLWQLHVFLFKAQQVFFLWVLVTCNTCYKRETLIATSCHVEQWFPCIVC